MTREEAKKELAALRKLPHQSNIGSSFARIDLRRAAMPPREPNDADLNDEGGRRKVPIRYD